MSNSAKFNFILLSVLVFVILNLQPATGQENNSLYFMDGIPQSNQLNPATQPKCNFFLGIPGISSLELNAGESMVGVSDVLTYYPPLGKWVNPAFNAETQQAFLDKLGPSNYVFSDVRNDLLSLGFRIRGTYLSFFTSEKVDVKGFIPKDMFKLMFYGNSNANWESQSFDFSPLSLNATWYREYGFGVSQEISNRFYFGIKAKFLFGKANIHTESSNTGFFDTDSAVWKTRAQVNVYSSIPNLNVYTSSDNNVDSLTFTELKDASDIANLLLIKKNRGFALDMGMVFKPVKMVSISASILDLGYIRWANNIHNLSANGSYDFKGVNFDFANSDSSDVGGALLDTLKSKYTTGNANDPYTTFLTAKLYAGVHVQLLKGIGVGFLTRSQIVDKKWESQYTFSLNLNAGNTLNTTFSYTIANHEYDILGFGLAMKLWPLPLQWHIMCETIPMYYSGSYDGVPIPSYLKRVNFRTGLNITIGYKRNKKIFKDKPLVED